MGVYLWLRMTPALLHSLQKSLCWLSRATKPKFWWEMHTELDFQCVLPHVGLRALFKLHKSYSLDTFHLLKKTILIWCPLEFSVIKLEKRSFHIIDQIMQKKEKCKYKNIKRCVRKRIKLCCQISFPFRNRWNFSKRLNWLEICSQHLIKWIWTEGTCVVPSDSDENTSKNWHDFSACKFTFVKEDLL